MIFLKRTLLGVIFCLSAVVFARADDSAQEPSVHPRPSSEIVRLAWEASAKQDGKALEDLVYEMLSVYAKDAQLQAVTLKTFPTHDQPHDQLQDYRIMNDVATVLFIKAEFLMHQGKNEESIAAFNNLIEEYPWAQSWDPSRGVYWSVAEKAQASIDVMSGKALKKEAAAKNVPRTTPTLVFPGTERVIDYTKYGKFLNEGTKNYHYQITDQAGLVAAAGEGIYPNIAGMYKDPEYKRAFKEGRLQGNHWDFVNSPDLQAAFYKWATAPEPWGVRLFYMGTIFEKAKMYEQAIKCYDALVVHFPETLAWTYWHTPWFPGQAAIAKIHYLIRMHPALKLEFKGSKIQILNSFDDDPSDKIFITTPGSIRELGSIQEAEEALNSEKQKIDLGQPVKTLGQGKVHFVQYSNGHWQLIVNSQPFLIQGMTYTPTKIGQSPDNGTLTNWTDEDPGPGYLAWVDKDGNNQQDADEAAVGDFKLMKDMGVNTIRLYYQTKMKPNKKILRRMFKDYGLMVMMGNFLGKYAIDSGASWADGTDYENPQHQKTMMEHVRDMVLEYKNEPYLLMWVLGNENNYGVASNADKKPEAYYKFVNEVAKMIKSIDPGHPVAICNGDTLFLDKFARFAPEVDAYGANVYRGDYGFGAFWQDVAQVAQRPTFITEYGAPAYGGANMSMEEAQTAQADYHRGNWLDILYNSAGYVNGQGNAVGGIVFEWVDEWWKNYDPSVHTTVAGAIGPFAGGYYYEAWFGLFGQGDGKHSPYLREPRKVYYTYKEMWSPKT